MLLHLQSLLGVFAQLVLFLILLNHSLPLALGVINHGARLGCFLHLCLWLPRCQHLNWFATSLATLQPLDSGLLHHQITSPWLLPWGKLIRFYQNFRLALVLLLISLSTWNSSFLTSELPLLILFPLYLILREELDLFLKCMNYLSRLMTFWTMHVSKMSWEVYSWFSTCLILLPGIIVRAGLHISPFFLVSRMWFLLVRLVCVAVYTGLWHRFSNSPS